MLSNSLKQRILQRFPKIQYCFAYGSGVKKQTGYDEKAQKNAVIDLIIGVDDAIEFHKQNIEKNPRDYSLIRFLGGKFNGEYQEYGTGVYCNKFIQIDSDATIEYGVISMEDLKDDLYHWDDLYVAGRLQKPVETLVESTDPEFKEHFDKNLKTALHMALLHLPKEFTYFQLFHALALISYTVNFRWISPSRKDKVRNIVEPQLEDFLKLYKSQLKTFSHCLSVPNLSKPSTEKITQCKSRETNLKHLEALPCRVVDILKQNNGSLEDTLLKPNLSRELDTALTVINWESGVGQTVYKNIPTTSVVNFAKYAARRTMKRFSK